ncbi:hypothetical protein COCNU_14G002570 [Cocos nucifera]|uniref:alpha,alpha-trehalose-phosphate synthase (UDP-forming) n=1 Tax=Cocos nucifera TaxID=13894 RepID=A0A8K0IVT1_COCNU|nr:hypothetical protein COCNU_14G002570 [Cocos nucifera]
MPGNKYNSRNPTRVERLLREREQRRSNRAFQQHDAGNSHGGSGDGDDGGSCGREREPKGPREVNCECGTIPNGEAGLTASKMSGNGCKRSNGKAMKQRLLVVANRLPVSAVRQGEDSWALEISAGGLVSALLGVKDVDAKWIGWAGVNVPDEVGQRALTKALAEKRCIPVFLDEEIVHQYYNGYCNNVLWPLFHYLGLPQEDRLATTRSFQSQFHAYKRANQMFADVVNRHYQEGDVVWCHDYHLMFLPKYLKEYNSKMKVGWFLHTPFPSSEIHRTLPSRSELLRSVLAADLVGSDIGELKCKRHAFEEGGNIEAQKFPIGIDSDRFKRALELPAVKEHINELTQRFADRKVMLGVDRLDMIKGIPQKILAFEKFLEENPTWRDKVVLLQIAVPTRTDVPEYQKLTSQVHEIVGRINGRFGTLTAVPIHHLDRSLDFHALCALYAVTDVALVTSLRDGMNLVSYEFVACQGEKKGVLILSENFGEYNMWLAAENGMFLRLTGGEWMTTMPEHLNMDWVDSVKHVFEYFTERTPRSHFEHRETSLVWNYKYADVEFGRLQARDMLQHLWTGPISNAAVDVVQGSRSVEVRSVGVTKGNARRLWLTGTKVQGAAIDRILGEIVHSKSMVTPIDFVLCIGHFLGKDAGAVVQDEDIYTFFEPELPSEPVNSSRSKSNDGNKQSDDCNKPPPDKRLTEKPSNSYKNSSRTSSHRNQRTLLRSERRMPTNHSTSVGWRSPQESMSWREGSSVLDLKGDNYFSCAVGRKRSNARYLLNSSDDVVSFLKELADAANQDVHSMSNPIHAG